MRVFLSALLTVLILACPFICGATEAIHLARGHHAGSSPIVPAHCPEDSDDCICRGAVQSADVRVPGVDAISSLLPPHGLVGALDHAPTHSLVHLTSDGKPTGLAGWGNAVTVRAYLQDFRC